MDCLNQVARSFLRIISSYLPPMDIHGIQNNAACCENILQQQKITHQLSNKKLIICQQRSVRTGFHIVTHLAISKYD